MFLVCTADYRFWKTKETVLFLGNWCKLHRDTKKWNSLKSEELEYHWAGNKDYNDSWLYVKSVYERCLKDISGNLNTVHSKNWDKRSWEIIIGSWLRYFIEVMYDRYRSLMIAKKSRKVSYTYIINQKNNFTFIPNNFQEFSKNIQKDTFNQFLYSLIIYKKKLFQFREINISNNQKKNKVNLIFKVYNFIIKHSYLFNQSDFVFYKSGFSKMHQICLDIKLRQIPSLIGKLDFEAAIDNSITINDVRRKIKLPIKGDSFEKLIREIIPEQIPKSYVEYFNDVLKYSNDNMPKCGSKVLSAGADIYDDPFKIWLGSKISKGAKFFAIQHGGGYGISKVMTNEDYQYNIADKFYSWGWEKSHNDNKVIPLPACKMVDINFRKKEKKNAKNILWIGHSLPRYSYKMSSEPIGPNFNTYIKDQIIFLKNLSKIVINGLLFRPYINDFGWDIENKLKLINPKLKINNSNTLKKEFQKSKLTISSFNGTTFLESITSNIPTVIFFNTKYFSLRSESLKSFEELKEYKIFFECPVKAANHINSVFENPYDWWGQKTLQNVRKNFCSKYAHRSKKWIDDWKNELINKN